MEFKGQLPGEHRKNRNGSIDSHHFVQTMYMAMEMHMYVYLLAQVHKPIKITPFDVLMWFTLKSAGSAGSKSNQQVVTKVFYTKSIQSISNSSMMFDMLWFWYDFQQFPTNSTDSQFLWYICYDLRIFEAILWSLSNTLPKTDSSPLRRWGAPKGN